MDTLFASDVISDSAKVALVGLLVGVLFGIFAQASRFCLRSACLEFWAGDAGIRFGSSVAIWLCVFGAALLCTQLLLAFGFLAQADIRQLTSPGTMSGAVIGGLMFGVGMILARGCASRLLVLSATGNARALLAGLVVTVVAQASLTGILSPFREALSRLWVVTPDVRNVMSQIPDGAGIALGLATLAVAISIAAKRKTGWRRVALALVLGSTVALGWGLTSALSKVSFQPVAVGSVTFTGPAADTLMALITSPTIVLEFGIGLVPGVFAGSLVSSLYRGEFRIQVFNGETGTVRYLVGAALMGFGGMLAGGCAVGAGVTGGAVLSLTAWVALANMWLGAGVCAWLIKLHTGSETSSMHVSQTPTI